MADAGNMICPKCGAFQPKAPTCEQCGVVVAKFKAPAPAEADGVPFAAAGGSSTGIGRAVVPVIAVIVIAVLAGSGFALFKDGGEAELERHLQDIEVFQVLKTHDPASYERLKKLLSTSMRERASKQQVIARVQAFSAGLMQEYVPHASDDAIDQYSSELMRILEGAREESAKMCYMLLYPKNYSRADVREFLEGQLGEDFLDSMAEVIRTAKESPQPLPDPGRSQELIEAAILPMADEYSEDDLMLFAKASHDKWEQHTVCEMGMDIYRRLLLLTKENSSAALRYMMSHP